MVVGALPIDPPQVLTTLCPLTRSNPGTSWRYAARNPPEASTLISAAFAPCDTAYESATVSITTCLYVFVFIEFY
jgi:hypothetical protein